MSEEMKPNTCESCAGNAGEPASRSIAWRPLIFVAGSVLFAVGAGRFVVAHHFGFMDALHCVLAVVPAGLLLLVFAYVVDHSRLASVPLLFVAGLLVFSSPVFDVALGLAVMGAAAGHALREWKDEKHLREFAPWLEGENCERK